MMNSNTPNKVNSQLVGVWKRQSITINSGDPYEDSSVIWMQTATRYADIRIGIQDNHDLAESFAGKVEWLKPNLTFYHELDYKGRVSEDICHLRGIANKNLYETGTVTIDDKKIQFKEHWQRQSKKAPHYRVYESRTKNGLSSIVIQIDDHLLLIETHKDIDDKYYASYSRMINDNWQVELEIGSPDRKLASFNINKLDNNWYLAEQSD